ncbi:uncharacterized protein LOC116845546 isoform X2 [Odontomachus brunneus]|nr:uncharacterized protein LOC116845546 isoform X2 [Odontomachus brunneus]
MKKVNENLEKNLASLLKTAKAEITRKDKMIEELRNQLDNVAFRRNRNGSLELSTLRSSYHNTMTEKYESVTPLINSEENTFISQQIESSYTEYKSRKPRSNTDQIPVTVFGERLHKRIMDDTREDKKLRASKLNSDTNVNKISEECIVESDKENGSQSSMNNNGNEFNVVTRSSNSDTSYKKNLGKRLNEEDDTCKNKRLKTKEDIEDRNDDDIDCNSMIQYDTKDDLTKLEDQLCAMYSIKKDQVPLETKRRATSEHGDMKQTQNCKNGWRKEERISASKDYSDTHVRKGSVDSSRSRTTSISNERFNNDHQHDHYINSHRKNDYRHGSSSSRSFFKNRNDYESSSSYRLREKSSRMYRDRKYDDYKYDSRYKNDRSRKNYNSKETSGVKTRYSSRERGDLRDRLRHTSDVERSDEERRSRSGLHKSNKYDNHRLKETMANSEDKRSHKGSKTIVEIDSRVSSSRTIVNNTVEHSVGKSTEQHSVKNETCEPTSSIESVSTCATTKDESHLEEGEILDSPKSNLKKNDSAKISTIQTVEKNVAETSIQVEGISENASVDIQRNTESTSHVKNDLTQFNPADECVSMTAETCFNNLMMNDLHSDKIVIYPSLPSPEIIGGCNNNGDYECEDCIEENVTDDANRPVEETYDFNNENVIRSEEVGNASAEDTTKVDEVTTMLGFASSLSLNINNIRQSDHEVASSASDGVTQVETVPNCENAYESRISNRNETFYQIPGNSNAEASHTCLGDHNYVRDTVIDVSDLHVVPNGSERHESAPDTATSKETEAEGTVNAQSVDTKKTTSTTVKSKKDQNSNKAVVISRRRKAVTLSDNNASMTVLINTDSAKLSLVVDNSVSDKSDTVSKPRACKLARTIKPPCK